MPGSVLVDSSYFIGRLRRGEDPFGELARFAEEYDFATCGVVMVEVLRGVKHPRAQERFAALLGSMIYVPTPQGLWERVAQLAWGLDRAGRFAQVTDLVVAACALEVDAAVLTHDADFTRIPKLRVLRRLG